MRARTKSKDIQNKTQESLRGMKSNNSLKSQEISSMLASLNKEIEELDDEYRRLEQESANYFNQMQELEKEKPRSKETQNKLNELWVKNTQCQLKINRVKNTMNAKKKKLEDWKGKI